MFGSIATALTVGALTFGACSAYSPQGTPPAETWAWCGVHPDDPSATKAVTSMANIAGIDATYGPCMAPDASYSPANPGVRYVSPDVYMRLLNLNASVGMKTIVYDARLWSEDYAIQLEAVTYWAPVIPWIAGWDMGDEFDPHSYEWDILVQRWNRVEALYTGVDPTTNHLPNNPTLYGSAVDKWIQQMPTAARKNITFDSYILDDAKTHAVWYRDWTDNLRCAVNAFAHGGYSVTPDLIKNSMIQLRGEGCDSVLVFGGHIPYGMNGEFGMKSLVDGRGNPTTWAYSVAKGATL